MLFILVNFRWNSAQTRRDMIRQVYELFAASDVTLEEDLDLDVDPLPTRTVQRDLDAEGEIAATLLGEAAEAVHQGGGIYAYTGTWGTVHFRSSGDFDYAPDGQAVEDPADFCQTFCERYGYEATDSRLNGTDGEFSAVKVVEGVVYNCTVTFRFQDGCLSSAAGTYVSAKGSTVVQERPISAIDALIRFLDYRGQSGEVYNRIRSIAPVYELQTSSAAPLQLTGKWQITTDTYAYYVDSATGDVTRG